MSFPTPPSLPFLSSFPWFFFPTWKGKTASTYFCYLASLATFIPSTERHDTRFFFPQQTTITHCSALSEHAQLTGGSITELEKGQCIHYPLCERAGRVKTHKQKSEETWINNSDLANWLTDWLTTCCFTLSLLKGLKGWSASGGFYSLLNPSTYFIRTNTNQTHYRIGPHASVQRMGPAGETDETEKHF